MQAFFGVDNVRRFDPEEIDLAALVRTLRHALEAPIEGPIVGRTRLRDGAARQLECSILEAEQLVDTMIARGFVFSTETGGMTVWHFSEQE